MKNNTMSFESIIKRGTLGTRIRDYYDVHMLLNTQNKNIDKSILKNAIISTAKHRETTEEIKSWKEVVDILINNQTMQRQWKAYQKDNFYAQEIKYEDLIESLNKIGEIYDNT